MEPHFQLRTLFSMKLQGNQTPWRFNILILIWAIREGSNTTSPQPVPAVNLRFVWKTPGAEVHHGIPHTPTPKVTRLSPVPAQLRGFTFTRFSPFSRQGSPCCIQWLYRRPYSQIKPIYQRRKGKRNTDKSLKWERSCVTSFKDILIITAALLKVQGIWLMFGPGIESVCVATPTAERHTVQLKLKMWIKKKACLYILHATWKMSHSIRIYSICGS